MAINSFVRHMLVVLNLRNLVSQMNFSTRHQMLVRLPYIPGMAEEEVWTIEASNDCTAGIYTCYGSHCAWMPWQRGRIFGSLG